MPEIDLTKLEDPEKALAAAEEAEGKVVLDSKSNQEDQDDEKIVDNGLDKSTDDDYTVDEELAEEEKQESSPDEDKARKRGWKPIDEYEGDPDKWIDAAEFNRQSPLHDTIADLSSRSKKTEKALNNLLRLFSKQEREITTAQLDEAKALREDAIRSKADPKLVDQFDTIIAEKSNALKNPAIQIEEDAGNLAPHEDPKINPLARAYIEKNLAWWYADDAESKAKNAYACAREEQLAKQLGGRIPKLYSILEAEMSERFGKSTKITDSGQKEGNKIVVKRAPGAENVTRGTSVSSKSRSVGRKDLDAEDQDTYDVIKRSGGDTKLFLKVMVDEGRIRKQG